MARTIEELEAQLARLRALLREASRARDAAAVSRVRAEMRSVEKAWEEALTVETAKGEAPRGGIESELEAPAPTRRPPRDLASVPVREQVNQALAILGAPASPKLISTAYQAFFADPLVPTKLASLRRDEERSFTAQGHSRPYYICAALTHDRLNPARGLLAVSNWPLERRIVAPLSPRTDFLTHAVGTAEQIQRLAAAGHSPPAEAWRLLRRFAFNIPGAHELGEPDPERIIAAARSEATVHQEADDCERKSAAARARTQLSDVQQLFGVSSLHILRGASTS
ncbi:hypothetical protein [Streptomyces sp. NBC_01477]|uniref:hypothetical protein n=1 Tax=Streptomyces sp. NBC_01477 TaxID=2976015 RepID=UPI002E35184B|nr:hypothetical protein [Streptomyces sp. NBC_01477]